MQLKEKAAEIHKTGLVRLIIEHSDFSDKSYYKSKRHNKKKIHWEKYPFGLCATLTPMLPITAYKSKIIMFKFYEDPLERRIYFLTFIESLKMIFPCINKLVKYS